MWSNPLLLNKKIIDKYIKSIDMIGKMVIEGVERMISEGMNPRVNPMVLQSFIHMNNGYF